MQTVNLAEATNCPYDAVDKSFRHMDKKYSDLFRSLIAKDNFFLGTESFFLAGDNAVENSYIWLACLGRANYKVWRTDPHSIMYYLSGNTSPYIEGVGYFDNMIAAECLFVYDMFESDLFLTMDSRDKGIVAWYIKDCILRGKCLVFPVDSIDFTIDVAGSAFSSFIEKRVRMLNVQEKADNKRTLRSNSRD